MSAIIKDGRDIYGDGVNLAARLEVLAEPGGICVSRVVRDQVRDKLAFSFEDMGACSGGLGLSSSTIQWPRTGRAMFLTCCSLQEKPNWVPSYRFLASCRAKMGRLNEAREAVKQIRNLTNVVVPSATNSRNPEHREFYLSGLRLAAGEAT